MAFDQTTDTGKSGLDRRTLIKRAAIVGAAAWTAPAIIGSVASPAGAISPSPGCYRLKWTNHDSYTCDRVTTDPPGCTPNPPCSNQDFNDIPDYPNQCVVTTNAPTTNGDCLKGGTWTLGNMCSCRFVAATARTNYPSGDVCTAGSIAANGQTATWGDPGSNNYNWYMFVIQCP
jgi:hypothetical protein